MSNTRLGRGLDSLLPKDFDSKLLLDKDERIQNLFTADIMPNPSQPRKIFDESSLKELAKSIKQYGVLQPIIVSQSGNKYEVIAGERRWRATKIAGIDTIPSIVRERAKQEKLEIALIENVQRVDLSAMEQARSIEYLREQFNLSYQDIAQKIGKAESTVNNIVRLLQLPLKAIESLNSGNISEGHARAILAFKNSPELQDKLLKLIIAQGWSVRQAEQFVTAHKQGIISRDAVKRRTVKETPQTRALANKLGVKVTIHHTAKGGKLEIYFDSDEALGNLYKKLS